MGQPSSPEKLPPGLKKVIDLMKIDQSAVEIRDMNKRLQHMLEETLTKNMHLQKVSGVREIRTLSFGTACAPFTGFGDHVPRSGTSELSGGTRKATISSVVIRGDKLSVITLCILDMAFDNSLAVAMLWLIVSLCI